jgi:hypothetical protein
LLQVVRTASIFTSPRHVLRRPEAFFDFSCFLSQKKKNWERSASIGEEFEFKNHGGDVRAERLVTQFKGFHLVSTPSLSPLLSHGD